MTSTSSPPQSIWIEHPNQTMANVGDMAMLIMDVERAHCLFPDARIVTPTKPADWLARHCPAAKRISASGLYRLSWRQLLPDRLARFLGMEAFERHWLLRNADQYLRIIAWRNRLRGQADPQTQVELDQLRRSDLVIAAGGGYFNDTFAGPAVRCTKVLLIAQSLGIPTFLFGQGLGPINRPDTRELLGTMLRRSRLIGLREGILGPRLLQELGVTDSQYRVTGDGAIELAARERVDELGDHLGFNIRIAKYANPQAMDLVKVGHLVAEFAQGLNVPVMPCPIYFGQKEPDEPAARAALPSSCQVYREACPFDPLEVIRRVRRCRVVVTGSYHAAVFALAQGIPVIGLAASQYYASKFDGLAGMFGAAMSVVYLDQPEVATTLVARMAQHWRKAAHLRAECREAADRQRQWNREVWAAVPGNLSANSNQPR
ncbi:MAG: polysaccharide pyruvyl transferase family protein [Verrucomicrobia bacterium]|nr:polysaccharide pyruvyl transferase family protein [Verrucomicrobiota bacterium]